MERDMIKISSAKSETKYIAHHGTEGMHWGKRKYQYEDGSLTPLGRIHYGVGEAREKSKIKMREARDAAKNEARVIKAQAKADAMKYKAEAKAYRAKKDAEEETERRRIEADKEMERNFGKEKTKQTQIEADARVEMNRQQYEPQQVKEKNYTALKVAGGLLAAAGIGYLLYKTFKSGSGGSGNQTFSKEVASKGEDTIKKLENSPASEIAKKGDEAVKSGGKSLGFFARRKAEKQSGKDFGNAALERLEKANRNAEVAKKVENANRLVKNDAINEMRRMADANATSAANQTKASRVLKSNFTRMINKTNKGGVKSQPWGNKPAGLENFGSFLKDYRKKHGTVFTARHSEEFMEGYVLVHSANPDVCHHGIKGQKWGVRRWQYEDGTLTPEGRAHYGRLGERFSDKNYKDRGANYYTEKEYNRLNKKMSKYADKAEKRMAKGKDPRKALEKALTNAEIMGNEAALREYGKAQDSFSRTNYLAGPIVTTALGKLDGIAEYGKYSGEVLQKYKNMSVEELKEKFADTIGKTTKVKKVYDRKEDGIKEEGHQDAVDRAREKYKDEPDIDPEENRRGPFKYENLKEFAEKDPEGYAKSEYGKYEQEAQKKAMKANKMNIEYKIEVDKEDDSPIARETAEKVNSGVFNKAILDAAVNEMYSQYKNWATEDSEKIISKEDFRKRIQKAGINSGYILKDGTANVYLNDGGLLYGHAISVEVGDDGKVRYVSLEG